MSEDIIANLIIALQQHPFLALFFVFLVAFSESLIVIGLLVPGAILMVIFGALIAVDALQFWPTVFFAVSGAVAGDSLSYWLGKRYQNKLHTLWPLSRHPEVITQANQFFNRHGVKSIIFSRFIGLLRPIIPAIAGMTRMPVNTFIAINISSAIFWAPAYLLPGLLFGLSLEMASEFASKFILLIIFLLFIIFVSLWVIQRIYIFTKPYNDKAIVYLLNWGEKHPIAGEVPAAIFDKTHPELRGLSLVALIIYIVTLILYLVQSTQLLPYNPFYFNFDSLDQLIYHSLQTFRSPPFDSVMLWLNYLSSSQFIALLCFSLGSLFIFKKNLFPLWHWLAAISLPLLLSPLLSNDLTNTLQQNINIQTLPFIVIVSTFGFLTIIISAGLSFAKQKLVYYFSASLVLFVMLAQLYFATQVFSQILFAFFIGLIWFNLLGIAYRRHTKQTTNNKIRKEVIFIITALLIYPSWKTIQHDEVHTPPENYFVMGTNSWIESGWETLPILREGIQPNKNNLFNLQWLGSKNNISSQLSQAGFSDSLNTKQTISNWFLDDIEINQLPILPHIHKGEYEALRFYRYNKSNKELIVIRLWPSIYQLKQDNPSQPLWFGSISLMEVKKHLGVTYLTTKKEQINELKLNNIDLRIDEKIVFENNTIFLLR
jgi:undecaprenyl-diphosphatase